MSRSDDAELAEFFRQQHSTLVRFFAGRGASLSDAEDAVQTVFTRVFALRAEVHMPRAYFY
jgi:DNA-directed RNA polymerase specialized sigma24 family protein